MPPPGNPQGEHPVPIIRGCCDYEVPDETGHVNLSESRWGALDSMRGERLTSFSRQDKDEHRGSIPESLRRNDGAPSEAELPQLQIRSS